MRKSKKLFKALALTLALLLIPSMAVQAETVSTEKAAKANPKVWRALCIGEANYSYTRASSLPACKNDALAMGRVLRKTGYKFAKVYTNRSKSQISSLIKSTFKYADSNDVSLFYYSGHGAGDGSLYTTKGEYISPTTLAGWLKKIPGTVIVMADSCYSGAFINKSADGSVTVQNPEAFNQSFVAAFAEADAQTKAAMTSSKFKVLTACRKNETSVCTSSYSIFTYRLISGAGYNYSSGRKLSSAPADYNKNKKVTLYESKKYIGKIRTGYFSYQTTCCYPATSQYKIFQR